MQITRTKKALIAVIALVLVGIFVALAAVYLPNGEKTLPSMDNTVADSGNAEDSLSTATASTTAPLEDGTVENGYVSSTGGTPVSDESGLRNNAGKNMYLTSNINISSLDTSHTLTGILDGCGKTITISGTASGGLTAGGLFATLTGTVKNVNIVVEKFSFSTTKAGRRSVGIIAGVLNGGTVDNVKITFKYSPSGGDPTQNAGALEAYFYDPQKHSNGDLDSFFGGVAGESRGGTIKNSTVYNATTGNYGVCIAVANGKGTFGSAKSDNSIGGFIGCATEGTLNLKNIRIQSDNNSVYSSWFYQAESERRNYSGVVYGWGWSESTLIVDGIIYDYNVNFDCLKFGSGTQTSNINNHFGSMFGVQEGGVTVKDVYAPATTEWLDGENDNIKGVILTDSIVMGFDDNNENNIIVKTQYNNPVSQSLVASVSVAGKSTSVLTAPRSETVNLQTERPLTFQ